MKQFIRVMKALSDPNRVKIIKMLGRKNLCVCEVTAVLGLAQPTVSKHLKVLEDAGLTESWREGAWVFHKLLPGSDYADVMLRHLHGWLADEPGVKAALAGLEHVDRERVCAA